MGSRSYSIALIAVLSLVVFAGTASAEAPAWSYVEAGYNNINVDSGIGDDDGDGWFAGASFGAKNWHLFGQYTENNTDDLDLDINQWFVGVGWHGLLGEKADLFGDVAYMDADYGGFDDSGYFGRVGVRWRLIKLLEIGASTRYQDLGDLDNDLVWNANAIFYVWKLGIGVNAEIADDIDTYNAFVRFNFE